MLCIIHHTYPLYIRLSFDDFSSRKHGYPLKYPYVNGSGKWEVIYRDLRMIASLLDFEKEVLHMAAYFWV